MLLSTEQVINEIKKELLVLEQHPYMGVPVTDEDDDPQLVEKIEALHEQIYIARKLDRLIRKHYNH